MASYNTFVPELSFFIGKGGVGKTTASAAYAVYTALQAPKKLVLLLSTDPAHSLSDVLQMPLGGNATKVPLGAAGKLYAWQVNAAKQFEEFLEEHRQRILEIIDRGSLFSRQDIEPLLDKSLPGMAEISALLALQSALESGKYDRIVVDTAPFGHTLRLFGLPEHFLHFLDFLDLAISRDRVLAQHFGGRTRRGNDEFLSEWRTTVEGLQESIARKARLFLVTTPEKFSLNESLRACATLGTYSPPLKIGSVVMMRAVRGNQRCKICRPRAQAARYARTLLRKEFPDANLHVGEDAGGPILGVRGLKLFANHLFSGKRLDWKAPAPKIREVVMKVAKWPVLDVPLSLVLGKGGVGKTTIAAGLGFNTREKGGMPVDICSVDPAPSLDDIFGKDVGDRLEPVLGDPKFRASEMDSMSVFKTWVAEVKEKIDQAMTSENYGVHIDLSFERELISELLDSVPPGVDEVLAVFRIIDLLSHRGRVVIDMAPTGHALDLLKMPDRILAWTRVLLKTLAEHRKLNLARDAGVKVAELAHRVRELASLLTDSEQACIYTVMLAEPLPDRETERLVTDLRSLNLDSKVIFINRVLFPQDIQRCQRCNRARRWQLATIAGLRRRYPDTTLYIVRNFPNEISGKKGLGSLTREIWQLA